jgi:hypothetical protein
MPRFGPQLVFTTVALIGALMGGTQPVQAGNNLKTKGPRFIASCARVATTTA